MVKKNVLISVIIALQFLFIILSSQIVCSEPIDNIYLKLNIESPEEVIETNVFTVTILANETPVEDVIVLLIDNIKKSSEGHYLKITDKFGQVQFTAPSLIHGTFNKNYSIIASKSDYISIEKNITIINIPNLLINEPLKSSYKFNEIVTISIIDNSNQPIENATIEFQGAIFHSDSNGKITLNTGSNIGYYELKITKEGYANYEYSITIYDQVLQPGPMIGFMLIIGMIITLIVILVIATSIVLYKKFRKN